MRTLIARFTGPREYMVQLCHYICSDEQGQDIAEYAVMLAVILVLVIWNCSFDRRQRQQRIFQRCKLAESVTISWNPQKLPAEPRSVW
jgi:hypothetical protein